MSSFTLILVRHGEAKPSDVSDKNRKLTTRGVEQSLQVGRTLKEANTVINGAVISDATRTQETFLEIQRSLQLENYFFEKDLYSAGNLREFSEAILNNDVHSCPCLMVIGHNPIISEVASFLTNEYLNLSTGEFVVIKSEVDSWELGFASSGIWSIKNI